MHNINYGLINTCKHMFLVPCTNFIISPFMLSKPKQDQAHRGPQFWTQSTRWRMLWTLRTHVALPVEPQNEYKNRCTILKQNVLLYILYWPQGNCQYSFITMIVYFLRSLFITLRRYYECINNTHMLKFHITYIDYIYVVLFCWYVSELSINA